MGNPLLFHSKLTDPTPSLRWKPPLQWGLQQFPHPSDGIDVPTPKQSLSDGFEEGDLQRVQIDL